MQMYAALQTDKNTTAYIASLKIWALHKSVFIFSLLFINTVSIINNQSIKTFARAPVTGDHWRRTNTVTQ